MSPGAGRAPLPLTLTPCPLVQAEPLYFKALTVREEVSAFSLSVMGDHDRIGCALESVGEHGTFIP